MGCPGAGALRVARALVLTVCGIALSIGGHLIGGGAPALAPLLVVAAFSGAAFTLVAGQRLGAGTILLGTTACQLAAHLLLSLEPAHAMAHDTSGGMALAAAGGHVSGLRMLAGHLVATVLATWLLGRGEDLVWSLAALLAPRLRRVPTPVPAFAPPRRVAPAVLDRPVRGTALLEVGLRHRGPPAACAA